MDKKVKMDDEILKEHTEFKGSRTDCFKARDYKDLSYYLKEIMEHQKRIDEIEKMKSIVFSKSEVKGNNMRIKIIKNFINLSILKEFHKEKDIPISPTCLLEILYSMQELENKQIEYLLEELLERKNEKNKERKAEPPAQNNNYVKNNNNNINNNNSNNSNNNSKKVIDRKEIKRLCNTGLYNQSQLAKKFKVAQSTVFNIIHEN